MKLDKIIWIVEDDKSAQFVYDEILSCRYKTCFFSTLTDFEIAVDGVMQSEEPDLIIADLKLPDGNFVNYLVRKKEVGFKRSRFIVVSSMDDLDVLRACYEEGALDFITKPFGKGELTVKVERIIEEINLQVAQSDSVIAVNKAYSFDSKTLCIRKGGVEATQLTIKEMQIFTQLNRAKNQVICRKDLVLGVWGDVKVGAKTLDVHLFNLRKKLNSIDMHIRFMPPDKLKLETKSA